MQYLDEIINSFVILWTVIDPIGTVPVFLAVTKGHSVAEKRKIAFVSSVVAFLVLMFFMVVGEVILRRVGVPLSAFQISGGVVLFLFALNMVFGSSKPEEEIVLAKNSSETAIFPLAIPSIAGPGAILAVVLLADSSRYSVLNIGITVFTLLIVLLINLALMHFSQAIHKKIGNSGAIVISKIMGLILAAVAANSILLGIKDFFKIA